MKNKTNVIYVHPHEKIQELSVIKTNLEKYYNLDEIKKDENINIDHDTLKRLYLTTPKNRECILFYLQNRNDKRFDGSNYTKNISKLYHDCYMLPKVFHIEFLLKDGLTRYPYDELFIWSFTLYSGKQSQIDLMKYYWSTSKLPLANCIAILLLSKRLQKYYYIPQILKDHLTKLCLLFRKLAIELLNEYFNVDEEIDQEKAKMIAQDLLIKQNSIYYFRTLLDLAVEAEEYEILNLNEIQAFMTTIWYLKINPFISKTKMFFCLICPLLVLTPLHVFIDNYKDDHLMVQDHNTQDGGSYTRLLYSNSRASETKEIYTYIPSKHLGFRYGNGKTKGLGKLNAFFSAPITRFIYHSAFFLFFLFYYTSFVLFDYFPTSYSTANITFTDPLFDTKFGQLPITITEIILIYWVVMHHIDNFIEFHKVNVPYAYLGLKIRRYFMNAWNLYDFLVFSIFYLALIIRLIPDTDANNGQCLFLTETCYESGRVLYCLALIFWYIRVLKYLAVIEFWGSKIIMIWQIARQLSAFVTIIMVFVLSFATGFQSVIFKTIKPSLGAIVEGFNRVYWPIFGEFSFIDDIRNSQCPTGTDSCQYGLSFFFLYISAVVYVVVCNLLLLNMMIAVFSTTVEDMNSKSEEIYKFHTYQFIKHYDRKLVTPPPIAFIGYFMDLFKIVFIKNYFTNDNFCIMVDKETESEYIDFETKNLKKYIDETSKDENGEQITKKVTTDFSNIVKKVTEGNRIVKNNNENSTVQNMFNTLMKQNEMEFKNLNEKFRKIQVELEQIKNKSSYN